MSRFSRKTNKTTGKCLLSAGVLAAGLGLSAQAQSAAIEWTAGSGGNGHFYEVLSGLENWDSARADALSRGGYLATITSAAENTFVTNLLTTSATVRALGWAVPTAPSKARSAGPMARRPAISLLRSMPTSPRASRTIPTMRTIWKSSARTFLAAALASGTTCRWRARQGSPTSSSTIRTRTPRPYPYPNQPASPCSARA